MSDLSKAEFVPAAMSAPRTAQIERRPGSIRRTSHIDMRIHGNELSLSGAARDLVTTSTGPSVVAAAKVLALVDDRGALAGLTIEPATRQVGRLIGRPVAGGFRDAVRSEFPEEVAAGTPLALLLDDLPVATLISGYARLYTGDVPADDARTAMKADICSGWRSEGTMMTSVRAGRGVPVTLGPTAPPLGDDRHHDAVGWHDIDELREGSMRRRRLIDVRPEDESWIVTAMFRDTHVQPGGSETVLHEYSLTGRVDATTRSVTACSAVPRVLPWVECPVAAASADRLAGQPIDAIRDYVRRELRGTSTCTHLNDLLRSLGDLGALVDTLRDATSSSEDERP